MFTSFRYIYNRSEFKNVFEIANVPPKRGPKTTYSASESAKNVQSRLYLLRSYFFKAFK